MLNDLRKSIHLILNERITSPLSGTVIFSWLAWNWRPVYYLVFSDYISITDRFKYIDEHYRTFEFNVLYPFLSTVFIIIVYPLFTSGALWVWLKYRAHQNGIKNKIEGAELLTVAQSRQMRMLIIEAESRFDSALKAKELEINGLKITNAELNDLLIDSPTTASQSDKEMNRLSQLEYDERQEFYHLIDHPLFIKHFPSASKYIGSKYSVSDDDLELLPLLFANDLIVRSQANTNLLEYTDKGKRFLNLYLNRPQMRK